MLVITWLAPPKPSMGCDHCAGPVRGERRRRQCTGRWACVALCRPASGHAAGGTNPDSSDSSGAYSFPRRAHHSETSRACPTPRPTARGGRPARRTIDMVMWQGLLGGSKVMVLGPSHALQLMFCPLTRCSSTWPSTFQDTWVGWGDGRWMVWGDAQVGAGWLRTAASSCVLARVGGAPASHRRASRREQGPEVRV